MRFSATVFGLVVFAFGSTMLGLVMGADRGREIEAVQAERAKAERAKQVSSERCAVWQLAPGQGDQDDRRVCVCWDTEYCATALQQALQQAMDRGR